MPDVLIDELLVFSDHHAHPFTFGSEEVLCGNVLTNSRLVESVQVIEQMHVYAETHKINKVVFGGDLFHTREAVPTEAYNLTHRAVASLARHRQVYMLVGNHDCADREGKVHSLYGFQWLDGVRVIDWQTGLYHVEYGLRGDPYSLSFVPYTEIRQQAVDTIAEHAARRPQGPNLLFAHLGMQGAKVGSDYVLVSDGDIGVDDIDYHKFAGCLFGHFHEHQPLFKNGWYIGASHGHNWGDVNTKRGFLHVRVYVDHIEFTQIESEAPRFLAVRESDLETTEIREKDFVKILTEKKLSPVATDNMRKTTKAKNVEVIYVPEHVKLAAVELDEKHLTPAAMVETWVKANEPWLREHMPGVADDELIEYGRTILAKVQDKHD